jgi:ATP-dependent Clp protease ATP-binding subunit ClpA
LLFGKLVNGGEVKVRIKDNAPSFEIVPAAPKVKAKPKKKAAAKKKAGEAPAAE